MTPDKLKNMERLSEAISTVQDEEGAILLDGIDELFSFVLANASDDKTTIGLLSTLNSLRILVRDIRKSVL